MIDLFNSIWPFLVVITVIVFFHELGHYWVARRNGVHVEVFSVGIGKELVGWTDGAGTRWRISLLPIGGYVKMFGQEISPGDGGADDWTREERAGAFPAKTVGQRFAIVLAGPVANFVLSAILFAGVFAFVGQSQTLPEATRVLEGSAAQHGGMLPGDMIVAVDGVPVERFDDLLYVVSTSPGLPLSFTVDRSGEILELVITPDTVLTDDGFGNERETGRLGIATEKVVFERIGPGKAIWAGVTETWTWIVRIFDFLGKIFEGSQNSRDLAGPLGIAQMSSNVADYGIAQLVLFMAILSVNLGLLNLFPIPLLDGGHLMFYVFEVLLGRPVSPRTQEYGTWLGLGLVVMLFLFVTFNDLMRIGVVDLLSDLAS